MRSGLALPALFSALLARATPVASSRNSAAAAAAEEEPRTGDGRRCCRRDERASKVVVVADVGATYSSSIQCSQMCG
jgi:hypothetical protein